MAVMVEQRAQCSTDRCAGDLDLATVIFVRSQSQANSVFQGLFPQVNCFGYESEPLSGIPPRTKDTEGFKLQLRKEIPLYIKTHYIIITGYTNQ